MKPLLLLFPLTALIFFPSPSAGVDLELVPSSNVVSVGSSVSIDVVITGLGESSAPSLGAFDVSLEYDDTLFAFDELTFGTELGDPAMLEALVGVTPLAAQIQVNEVSLLLPATLNGAQGDSFVLFTATFDAVAVGDGPFDIGGSATLADELGVATTLDRVVPTIVTVDLGQSVVDVPTLSEWGAIVLLSCLMFSAVIILRRRPSSGAVLSVFLCVALLGSLVTGPVHARDGDLEPDGDVDLIDVRAIYAALGEAVSIGDARDLDEDGVITVLDTRMAVACCNLAACAVVDNSAPTITSLSDQTILEDGSMGALAFVVGDDNTDPASLIVTAVSSNPTLIPNADIVLGGADAARTISLSPAADSAGGPVTITVTVDDGFLTTDETFSVTVTPVNDVPTFTVGADLVINTEIEPLVQVIPNFITGISAGGMSEDGQTLTFNVIGNTDPGLFTVPPSIDSSGTLSFTIVFGAFGSSTITVELEDDGGTADGGVDTSASQSFDIDIFSPR